MFAQMQSSMSSPSAKKSPRDEIQPFIDFAFVEFGMSEDEFLRQTPIQWHRIMGAWLIKERRENIRTARICSTLANVFGNQTTIEDFMPRDDSEEETEQTPDQMLYALASVAPKSNG